MKKNPMTAPLMSMIALILILKMPIKKQIPTISPI